VPADKPWGAQTQRLLEHFSIGQDLIPREMITAYAILKKAAANANHAGRRLDDSTHRLIVQACDEILAGQHHDVFPLHVWMTARPLICPYIREGKAARRKHARL
jgi:fumarate hydratase class II